MVTRNHLGRIAKPDEVDLIFGDETVRSLMEIAGIDVEFERRFGEGLRRSVRSFLEDVIRLDKGQIRSAIISLSKCINRALEGKAGAAEEAAIEFSALPDEAKKVLKYNANRTGKSVPPPEDIRDPEKRHDALIFLFSCCVRGATIKEGRKRGEEKRSRPTLQADYFPSVSRGRAPYTGGEILLCASIGQLYLDLTGRMPHRTRDQDRGPCTRDQDRGPFVALMAEVIDLIDAGISAETLVHDYEGRTGKTRPVKK